MAEYNGKTAPRWAVDHMVNKDRVVKSLEEENERLRAALEGKIPEGEGLEIKVGSSELHFGKADVLSAVFHEMDAGKYDTKVSITRRRTTSGRIFLDVMAHSGTTAVTPRASNCFEIEVVDSFSKLPNRHKPATVEPKAKIKKGKS